eukprot:SAG11_NODE_28684_length_319_cov_0.572727_1_plen_40_part_01
MFRRYAGPDSGSSALTVAAGRESPQLLEVLQMGVDAPAAA